MIIKSIRIFRYGLPLQKPFYLKGTPFYLREGLILQLNNEGDVVGYGEISPLPGFSLENLIDAREQLQGLSKKLIDDTLPDHVQDVWSYLDAWLPDSLYPSVRFGVEMAILNLFAKARNISLNELLGSSANSVPVTGLLQGSRDEVITQAKAMLTQGFSSFKLKVGGEGGLSHDVEKVRALQDVIHSRGYLRLDANRSWTFQEAVSFAQKIDPQGIEYIEEPFVGFEQIPEFVEETGLQVAFDESLNDLEFECLEASTGIIAVVLKPTILGGLRKTLSLAKKAKEYGLTTVVSSSVETELGVLALGQFSAVLNNSDVPAGLDTFKYFQQGLFQKSLSIQNGALSLDWPGMGTEDFHDEFLKEIYASNH